LGHLTCVAVVEHPSTLATGVAVSGFQGGIVKRMLGQFTRAASGTFYQMDIGQAQGGQLLHYIFKQCLRVSIMDVVGGRDGRQANTHFASANGLNNGARYFEQQTGAVFDAAAVVIFALVGPGFEKLL
jgi:hypothetical protein